MGVKGRFCLFEEVMKSINFTGVLFVLWSIGSAMAAPQWRPWPKAPIALSAPAAPPPKLVVPQVPQFQIYQDQDYPNYYGGGCQSCGGKNDYYECIVVTFQYWEISYE